MDVCVWLRVCCVVCFGVLCCVCVVCWLVCLCRVCVCVLCVCAWLSVRGCVCGLCVFRVYVVFCVVVVVVVVRSEVGFCFGNGECHSQLGAKPAQAEGECCIVHRLDTVALLHTCSLLYALDHHSNALASAQVVPQNRVALDCVAERRRATP